MIIDRSESISSNETLASASTLAKVIAATVPTIVVPEFTDHHVTGEFEGDTAEPRVSGKGSGSNVITELIVYGPSTEHILSMVTILVLWIVLSFAYLMTTSNFFKTYRRSLMKTKVVPSLNSNSMISSELSSSTTSSFLGQSRRSRKQNKVFKNSETSLHSATSLK